MNPTARRTGTTATETYRAAARQWSTGVALLTAQDGETVFAKTVSSLCTLSLEPPLVGVAVDGRSPLAAAVRASRRYALSVLGRDQEALARRFAAPGAGAALGFFTGLPTRLEATGTPLLERCLSWFDCRLHSVLPAGDHVLLVGSVVAADASPGDPLLYHDGAFRSLEALEAPEAPDDPPTPDSRAAADTRDPHHTRAPRARSTATTGAST